MTASRHATPVPTAGAVRSAVGWSALHVWGTQAVNLLIFAILARLLAPEAFGLIALAAVVVSLAKSLVDQGMSTAIIQRRDILPIQLDSVFWISVGVGGAFSVLGIALASPFAAVFDEPALASVVRFLSAVFLVDALGTVQQALLRRRFEFRALAIRGLVAIVVGGLLGVALALKGWGVGSLVAQQIATAVTGAALLWHLEPWRPRFRIELTSARELIAFGYNILGIRLLTFASRRSDDLLVGYFLGTVALGYYTVAYKIYKILLDVLSAVVARVALPALASVQEDTDSFRRSVGSAIQAVALVSLPIFCGVALLAPDIVLVMFGDTWISSGPVMQVLAVAGVTQGFSLIFQQAFIAHGRPSWAFRLSLVSTVALIVGFLLSAQHGIVWVAAAFGLVGLALLPVQLLAMQRMVGFGFSHMAVACRAPVFGSAVMIMGVTFVQGLADAAPPVLRLSMAVPVGALIYTAGVLIADRQIARNVRSFATRSAPIGSGAPITPTTRAR